MSGIIAQNSGRHTGLVKASSGGGGVWNLILTQTASASSTISFTSGIDSTYDEYVFKFINIQPGTDEAMFMFNFSIDTGSNYNVTKTSTVFYAGHTEADATGFGYATGQGLAQSTDKAELIAGAIGSAGDESCSGEMFLYAPSSTTFVKHWTSVCTMYGSNPQSQVTYGAGYGNTTSAVDAVQFTMSSGNIAAGTISLFGIT